MMVNLFSSFDPSTGFFSINWLSSMFPILFFPYMFWFFPNRYMYIYMLILKKLNNEMNILIGKKSMGLPIFLLSLFFFIFYNNYIGLLPYVFTSSSHLVFTISLALPLWLTFMMIGWITNMNHMFCHLVPMGTPIVLMPFMVCIETISNIIRPMSLAVRLTANMIAGHLLMTLLGNNSIGYSFFIYFIVIIQMILMLFESAVCMIQSYVFMVLSTLYSSEVL